MSVTGLVYAILKFCGVLAFCLPTSYFLTDVGCLHVYVTFTLLLQFQNLNSVLILNIMAFFSEFWPACVLNLVPLVWPLGASLPSFPPLYIKNPLPNPAWYIVGAE